MKLSKTVYRVARTRQELEDVFSLVYKEYMQKGYIPKGYKSKLRISIYNASPLSTTFVAKEGSTVKTIRFGQQGVTGDHKPTARQASFKARHAKNIAKGKMSAAYWADKVKW